MMTTGIMPKLYVQGRVVYTLFIRHLDTVRSSSGSLAWRTLRAHTQSRTVTDTQSQVIYLIKLAQENGRGKKCQYRFNAGQTPSYGRPVRPSSIRLRFKYHGLCVCVCVCVCVCSMPIWGENDQCLRTTRTTTSDRNAFAFVPCPRSRVTVRPRVARARLEGRREADGDLLGRSVATAGAEALSPSTHAGRHCRTRA